MERGLTKNQIVELLALSPHGDLGQYTSRFLGAVDSDPEFSAHFISYASVKSQVRDIGQALPIISLAAPDFHEPEFVENSLAHLAQLTPRDLLRAVNFAKEGPSVYPGIARARHGKTIDKLVRRYLKASESDAQWMEKTILGFKRQVQQLYFLSGLAPSKAIKRVLYDRVRPVGSSLEVVQELDHMDPREAAAAIADHGIPFIQLFPILKKKVREPALLSAIIERASPTELQTNMKVLERMGVNDHPETRAALDLALESLAKSGKKTVLKTTKAAESNQIKNAKTVERLREVQEKQLDTLKNVEGDWVLLVDKSGSMNHAIGLGVKIASILARAAKGRVSLIFFDTGPRYLDVTGKSYEEITSLTRHVQAGGATSIGCGLQCAIDNKVPIDGIAVITDGGHNTSPAFWPLYDALCKREGKSAPVYMYSLSGEADVFSPGHDIQVFNLRHGQVDEYSLPNLVQTMRTNRYSIHDEILGYKLLTVDKVLGVKRKEATGAR